MNLEERMQRAMEAKIQTKRQRLEFYIGRFKGLSPLEKLNQGFSFVSDDTGHTIRSVSQVEQGDILQIQVTDGKILANVTDTISQSLPGRKE